MSTSLWFTVRTLLRQTCSRYDAVLWLPLGVLSFEYEVAGVDAVCCDLGVAAVLGVVSRDMMLA